MAMRGQWLWIGLLMVLVLVGSGSAGYAYPTLLGMTGGAQTPSPQLVPAGQYDLAVDYTNIPVMGSNVKVWPVRLVGGASERAELGIAYSRFKADTGEQARITDVGAKYLLWAEPVNGFDLAVGGDYGDLGGEWDATLTRAYGVMGKTLTPVHHGLYEEPSATQAYAYAGMMYTRYADGVAQTSTRPFFGLQLTGQGGGSLALEYKLEEHGEDVASAVVRYQFNPTLMGEVGATKNLGGMDLSNANRVFGGLVFRFGMPQEDEWEW